MPKSERFRNFRPLWERKLWANGAATASSGDTRQHVEFGTGRAKPISREFGAVSWIMTSRRSRVVCLLVVGSALAPSALTGIADTVAAKTR